MNFFKSVSAKQRAREVHHTVVLQITISVSVCPFSALDKCKPVTEVYIMLRDRADVIDANAHRKKDHRHALQNSSRPVSSLLY